MKYYLRLTSPRRVRWLVWLALGLLGMLVAWVSYASSPASLATNLLLTFFAYTVVAAIFLLFCWSLLLRRPGWVELAADSVAWANPAASQPNSYSFAQIRAYRFTPTKNGLGLRLYLRSGEQVRIDGKWTDEFTAFWQAFDQAIRRYNQLGLTHSAR
ncbi:MAG: hypothetical protein ACRYFX_12465 [Janthinobacterium lividum]